MPNTYTQLYIQLVFAVQHRKALIHENIRDELQKYITGIAQAHKHKMLAIYCNPDHTHVLVGLNATQSLSSLANVMKSNSSCWLNETKRLNSHFNWQDGYGAFSYHKSQLDMIVKYVRNQKEHHKNTCFKEEYLELLKEFNIDYDDRYLFTWLE